MKLISVVIPAKNEEVNIARTIQAVSAEFLKNNLEYEIIVVNDGSTDLTEQAVEACMNVDKRIKLIHNKPPFGFGYAIRKGLEHFCGDCVIISMADSSDDPQDMIRYVREIERGHDCCFGNRWVKGAIVRGYPRHKKILNRMANWGISVLFRLHYTDVTNAFKCYSRETIQGIQPILSRHFNITVELPLKAIVRGYHFNVIPTHWQERKKGKTKLILQEMGSRYLFIIIYILIEKLLSGGDYKRETRKTI
jgi:dolichol-phosphate mannosyltransferase